MICDKCGTVIQDSHGCLKCEAQRRSHLAVVREIDRQNSSVTYKCYRSQIIAQFKTQGRKVANEHCIYDNWTCEQSLAFFKEKLGNNHKLVKILENNQQK